MATGRNVRGFAACSWHGIGWLNVEEVYANNSQPQINLLQNRELSLAQGYGLQRRLFSRAAYVLNPPR